MKYKYKIVKVIDGNNKITYEVKYKKNDDNSNIFRIINKVFFLNMWQTYEDSYNNIKNAQDRIKVELIRDKRAEIGLRALDRKVLKEYVYTDVPNHIPEEQAGKFMEMCNEK